MLLAQFVYYHSPRIQRLRYYSYGDGYVLQPDAIGWYSRLILLFMFHDMLPIDYVHFGPWSHTLCVITLCHHQLLLLIDL